MVLTVMFLMGIARGNLVAGHKVVSRYSLCLLVFGRGPTQSIIIFSKGVLGRGVMLWQNLGRAPGLLTGKILEIAEFINVFSHLREMTYKV